MIRISKVRPIRPVAWGGMISLRGRLISAVKHSSMMCAAAALPLIVAMAAPAPSAAQGSAPVRPDFRVLRFDENWSALRGTESRPIFDRPKYVAIDETNGVYFSFGGQVRSRVESVSNFGLTEGAGSSDTFTLLRALLHADLHAGEHVRLFAEGKHAVAFDRSLPGGRRPLDHDEWAVQNLFIDLSARLGDGVAAIGRVGRQELLLGSQRLVSPLDWANTRRTFDGLRLTITAGAVSVDGFAARPVIVRIDERNRRDGGTLFWGGEVRPERPTGGASWSLYLLGLSQDEITFGGFSGEHDRLTLGGRLTGAIGSAAYRYDVEAGWQTGSVGEGDVSAWFVATDLTRNFPSAPWRPALTIGADYASGDGDADDGKVGTFHQLFPLGHAYAGYMDLLGRQNLVEGRAAIVLNPLPAVQIRGAAHRFLRASGEDAAYNVGGGVFRPADGASRAIGTELDLTAAYRATRHIRVEGGYGHFIPGAFTRGSATGGLAGHWFYASTTLTF